MSTVPVSKHSPIFIPEIPVERACTRCQRASGREVKRIVEVPAPPLKENELRDLREEHPDVPIERIAEMRKRYPNRPLARIAVLVKNIKSHGIKTSKPKSRVEVGQEIKKTKLAIQELRSSISKLQSKRDTTVSLAEKNKDTLTIREGLDTSEIQGDLHELKATDAFNLKKTIAPFGGLITRLDNIVDEYENPANEALKTKKTKISGQIRELKESYENLAKAIERDELKSKDPIIENRKKKIIVREYNADVLEKFEQFAEKTKRLKATLGSVEYTGFRSELPYKVYNNELIQAGVEVTLDLFEKNAAKLDAVVKIFELQDKFNALNDKLSLCNSKQNRADLANGLRDLDTRLQATIEILKYGRHLKESVKEFAQLASSLSKLRCEFNLTEIQSDLSDLNNASPLKSLTKNINTLLRDKVGKLQFNKIDENIVALEAKLNAVGGDTGHIEKLKRKLDELKFNVQLIKHNNDLVDLESQRVNLVSEYLGIDDSSRKSGIDLEKLDILSALFPDTNINDLTFILLTNPQIDPNKLSGLCKIFPTKSPEELSDVVNQFSNEFIETAVKENIQFDKALPRVIAEAFNFFPEVDIKTAAKLLTLYPDESVFQLVKIAARYHEWDVLETLKKARTSEYIDMPIESAFSAVVLAEIFPGDPSWYLRAQSGDMNPERLKNIAQLKRIFPQSNVRTLITKSDINLTTERMVVIEKLKALFPEGDVSTLIDKSDDLTPERLKNIAQLKRIFPQGSVRTLITKSDINLTTERMAVIEKLKVLFPQGESSTLIEGSYYLTAEHMVFIEKLKVLFPQGEASTLIKGSYYLTAEHMVFIEKLKVLFPQGEASTLIEGSYYLTAERMAALKKLKVLFPQGEASTLIEESYFITAKQMEVIEKLKTLFPEGDFRTLFDKSDDLTAEHMEVLEKLKALFPQSSASTLIFKLNDFTAERMEVLEKLTVLFPQDDVRLLINGSCNLTAEQLKTIVYLKKRAPHENAAYLFELSVYYQRPNRFFAMLNTVNPGNLIRWMTRKSNTDAVRPETVTALANANTNARSNENSHWFLRMLHSANPFDLARRLRALS